jgi:hypothetical protein
MSHLKRSVFWNITPCSLLKVNRRFGGTCRLHLQGRRISQARNQCEAELCLLLSCLAYSSSLKMCFRNVAKCSSGTSVDFQRTTWCYYVEDRPVHNRHCENLKTYNLSTLSKTETILQLQNVMTILSAAPHHEDVWGREDKPPRIFSLNTRRTEAVISMFGPLYLRWKRPH